MSSELLLQRLRAANSSEQKSALVAESIIHDLPPILAKIAIWCSFLPWFSEREVRNMSDEELNETDIKRVIDLPFVEKTSSAYFFHTATRRGLLQKYKTEKPDEIVAAIRTLDMATDDYSQTLQSLLLKLYGYVITNQGLKAEDLLQNILEGGKLEEMEALSLLNEAEEFCISDGIGLTPKYWLYRGSIFLLEEDLEAARKCADNALALDKNYYQAYSVRSVAQAQLGNFDDAFRDINMAIQARPDEMLYRSRAMLFALKNDYKNSVFDFTRALRINPKDIQAYIGRARVHLLNKREEKATHDLDAAVALSENSQQDLLIYTFYAEALVESNKIEKALVFYDKLNQIRPSSGQYRKKGNILFWLGKLQEANESYEQSLKLNDENQYAYLGRGKLHLLEGDYEKAILDFKKALSLKPSFYNRPLNNLDIKEANLRLWETYIRLGDVPEAERQKNVLINTQSETELREILYFCRKYELFETMIIVSKKLLENQELLIPNYMAVGYALNQKEDYQNALGYFEKEEQSFPSGVTNRINMGISYWGMEDYERARYYFEEANKALNKKSKNSNFNAPQKSYKGHFAERVWLKVVFGNLKSALHSIEEHLQSHDVDIDQFYDLRDWGAVVKRFPDHLPEGFDEFYDRVSKVLLDIDSNSIYKLTSGI